MKSYCFLVFFALLSLSGQAQIVFEKGYFIDNSGQRTECLIRNLDWKSTPTEFEYKLQEAATPQIATIATVKEFGITGSSKFQRFRVDLDRSSDKIATLSKQKEPEYREEVLFVKVLVEGVAALYQYTDGNLSRFFYALDSTGPKPLVYKKYLVYRGAEKMIAENTHYQQQLWEGLNCNATSLHKLRQVKYTARDLTRYFTAYNTCTNPASTPYQPLQKRKAFHLRLTPGLSRSSLTIGDEFDMHNYAFRPAIGTRLGLEIEYVLPFNKGKWSLLAEPAYQLYKDEAKTSTKKVTIDYSSIELPLLVRHYFFLSNSSKLFANVGYVLNQDLNAEVLFEYPGKPYQKNRADLAPSYNFALGMGYSYKKLGIEVRAHTNRLLTYHYPNYPSSYRNLSFIVGYSLF